MTAHRFARPIGPVMGESVDRRIFRPFSCNEAGHEIVTDLTGLPMLPRIEKEERPEGPLLIQETPKRKGTR